MIELTPTPTACSSPSRANPEPAATPSSANTQVPEQGKATQAIRELLATSLSLPPSRVTLIQGDTQPHKLFLMEEVTLEWVQEWLESVILR